jgi:hypothetical protein
VTQGEQVRRFRPVVAVILATIFPSIYGAGPTGLQRGIARVSVVNLSHAMNFDHKSLIVIPLEDCSVLINGQNVALKKGDYKEFSAGDNLDLRPASAVNPRLALVEVVASSQALTVSSETLVADQEFEDASSRNQTLVIALDNLQIKDKQNLAPEGEPWKSTKARVIQLQRGETAWLNQGMHRVRNAGSTVARFITIEW